MLAAWAGGFAAEYAAKLVFGGGVQVANGSTAFFATLLALMLPLTVPLWIACVGGFSAVFLGKEIFGGLGKYPWHPVLIGLLLLEAAFPILMHQIPEVPEAPGPRSFLLDPQAGTLGSASFLAVAAGAGVLIFKKLIRWEVPVLFFCVLWGLNVFRGAPVWQESLRQAGIMIPFWILTDPVTSPTTRAGNRIYAVAAAGWTVLIGTFFPAVFAAKVSVLVMNAATPWIDHYFRPSAERHLA